MNPVNCSSSELCTFLRALAEGSWPTSSSDTCPSGRSRSIPIACRSYTRGNRTVAFRGSRCLMTSEHSTGGATGGSPTLLPVGFPARTSPARAGEPASAGPDQGSGPRWHGSFAKWDQNTSSWRTFQFFFHGGLASYSGTWPRWGTMRSGACWERDTWEHRTSGTVCGFLPTPTATPYGTNVGGAAGRAGKIRPELQTMARRGMWPTPTAMDGRQTRLTLNDAVGGMSTPPIFPTPTTSMLTTGHLEQVRYAGTDSRRPRYLSVNTGPLNPEWVEWLMGWPIGWTALGALGMDRFQRWRRLHGVRYIDQHDSSSTG